MEDVLSKINKKLITSKEIKRVSEVLRSGLLARPGGGPTVKEFQTSFARHLSTRYCFATSSGTTALHTAVSLLNLKGGDEIIIPALANIADASVVLQERATPVFADIHSDTFCIDPLDVLRKITRKTKAIIFVHMYGQPAEIEDFLEIAKKHRLILIEDCAQANGAKYKNRLVGSFGDLSCFSFYQTKNITCGEGGMICTNNKEYIPIIDSLLDSGLKKDNIEAYNYDRLGYNYRLTEIQAAIGAEQIKRLKELNLKRRENASLYREKLKNLGIIFQKEIPNTENVYFYLTGLLPESTAHLRDEFIQRVRKNGVPIKNLYPLPLHKVDLFKRTLYSCPNAEDVTKRLFNLYVNPGFSKSDIGQFSKIITKVYTSLTK